MSQGVVCQGVVSQEVLSHTAALQEDEMDQLPTVLEAVSLRKITGLQEAMAPTGRDVAHTCHSAHITAPMSRHTPVTANGKLQYLSDTGLFHL